MAKKNELTPEELEQQADALLAAADAAEAASVEKAPKKSKPVDEDPIMDDLEEEIKKIGNTLSKSKKAETPKARKVAKVVEEEEEEEEEDEEEKQPEHTDDSSEMDDEDKKGELAGSKLGGASKNDTMKTYMNEIGQISLVTKEQEVFLAAAIHGEDNSAHDEARKTLIKANLRLVVKIAHDFKGLGLPLLDLISEGNIGLGQNSAPMLHGGSNSPCVAHSPIRAESSASRCSLREKSTRSNRSVQN